MARPLRIEFEGALYHVRRSLGSPISPDVSIGKTCLWRFFRPSRFHLTGLQQPRALLFSGSDAREKTRSSHPSRSRPIRSSSTTSSSARGITDAPETARYRQFVHVGSVQNLWLACAANPWLVRTPGALFQTGRSWRGPISVYGLNQPLGRAPRHDR